MKIPSPYFQKIATTATTATSTPVFITSTYDYNQQYSNNHPQFANGIDISNPNVGSSYYLYFHDDNWNLTGFDQTHGSAVDHRYYFDQNDHLIGTANSVSSGIASSYVYDPSGQRIKTTSYTIDSYGLVSTTGNSTYYPTKYYNATYASGGTSTSTPLTESTHIFAGDLLLATLTTPNLTQNLGTCSFNTATSTTLSSSCTITGTVILPYSLTIASSTTVTLSATSTLLMDLKHNHLIVKKGGGLKITHGATFRQVKSTDSQNQPVITYHLTDHLGSVQISTNSAGTVTELSDYYPYGSVRLDQTSGNTNKEQRKYIGEQYDTDTSLSYLNARYYDGMRGQFLSEDPVFWEIGQTKEGKAVLQNPQAQNSYSYAQNNPIVNKDPSGRCIEDACVGEALILTSPEWAPVLYAGAAATAVSLYYGTSALLRNVSDYGSRWSGTRTTSSMQQLGFPTPPNGFEDWDPNNFGKIPAWMKALGIGSFVSGAAYELLKPLYDQLMSSNTQNNQAYQSLNKQLNVSSGQERYQAVQNYNTSAGATSNESKLWVTPGGAVITWTGQVIAPAVSSGSGNNKK